MGASLKAHGQASCETIGLSLINLIRLDSAPCALDSHTRLLFNPSEVLRIGYTTL